MFLLLYVNTRVLNIFTGAQMCAISSVWHFLKDIDFCIFVGIRIFNNLPPYIKNISNNVKKFKNCLERFLHIHSFCSLEEYFQHKFFSSWKCSHFSTICCINVVKCVICVLCFTDYNCWQSYLTSSSVCNHVYNCLFVTMAVLCILYTKFCSSTVSSNTYVLTWNQFDSKD